MKFFVAKISYADGTASHPLSLFSENMRSAMERLKDGLVPDVKQIVIRERTMAEAPVSFGRDKEGPAVIEHSDMEWWPED